MPITTKSILSITGVIAASLFAASAQALPTVNIVDTYFGSDDHGYGDRIGNNTFEVHSMDVTLTGTVLNVQVNTNYAGNTGTSGTGYGDLFLGGAWMPSGTGPEYLADNHITGTQWTYGFSLDGDTYDCCGGIVKGSSDRFSNDAGGTGSLYQLAGATNDANAILSDDVTGSIFRNGQEVIVDTSGNAPTVDTGVDGAWTISSGQFINFSIDLAGTDLLLGNEISLHWGMTCANDTIEGSYGIPEPGILALMSTGLLGLFATQRRRNKKSS